MSLNSKNESAYKNVFTGSVTYEGEHLRGF